MVLQKFALVILFYQILFAKNVSAGVNQPMQSLTFAVCSVYGNIFSKWDYGIQVVIIPFGSNSNFKLFKGMICSYTCSATWCYKKAVTTLFSRQHHARMWYLGSDVKNIDTSNA